MRSFRKDTDRRRKIYLSLAGSIENQLREAFAKRNEAGNETQSSLAAKLGVNRSVVNRRLTGKKNMNIETIADMVWALDQCIEVNIFDPSERKTQNHPLAPERGNDPVEIDDARAPAIKSTSREIRSKLELAY